MRRPSPAPCSSPQATLHPTRMFWSAWRGSHSPQKPQHAWTRPKPRPTSPAQATPVTRVLVRVALQPLPPLRQLLRDAEADGGHLAGQLQAQGLSGRVGGSAVGGSGCARVFTPGARPARPAREWWSKRAHTRAARMAGSTAGDECGPAGDKAAMTQRRRLTALSVAIMRFFMVRLLRPATALTTCVGQHRRT